MVDHNDIRAGYLPKRVDAADEGAHVLGGVLVAVAHGAGEGVDHGEAWPHRQLRHQLSQRLRIEGGVKVHHGRQEVESVLQALGLRLANGRDPWSGVSSRAYKKAARSAAPGPTCST